MPSVRWPLEDLLRLARIDQATLARVVKVDPSTVTRHMASGLTTDEADQWCFAVGMHPGEVWHAWGEPDAFETPNLLEML